jgi:fructokinase
MAKPEIICLGEALIDIAPLEKGLSIVANGKMQLAAGGAPANVAVGLARLGTASGFMGCLGDDFFGHYLRDVLNENGVDTATLYLTKAANTGLAFISWDARGDAEYLFYRSPSADTVFAPEQIQPDAFEGVKVLQIGSLLLATEPSGAATFRALELARKSGALISYDLNLRLSFWESPEIAREKISKPLEYASIVKLNRGELAFLTGEDDPAAGVAKLWRDNFRLVVVTLDTEGCYFHTATKNGKVGAYKVTPVDTVGAGDSFLAGLLHSLNRAGFRFEDESIIREACRQAAASGALAVMRAGAIPSLPTAQEVADFLANQS